MIRYKKNGIKPWISHERRNPISDDVKIKYLGRNCFYLDAKGNVKYNVRYIQYHYADYDTLAVYKGDYPSDEHTQYMNLKASLTFMCMYRDAKKY
jgi:hypothetical protein